MRVLVISHNVFSLTNNMGKTLKGYFSKFAPDELAQFYIHSQVPTSSVCNRYYRVTDKEAIKSIIGITCGIIFTKKDIDESRLDSRTDVGVTATLYQKARKRTPLIYIARNIWWALSHWDNKRFHKWIDEFNPECVFLASGDYAFIYDIATKIAKSRRIPLFVSCMDDYYLCNKNSESCMGRIQHRLFMKKVYHTMSYASKIFCICDKMSFDYSKLFNKQCITVHTPSTINSVISLEKKKRICYLGNLGYRRYEQLIDIGRALKELNTEPCYIDVYSSESRKEILDMMNTENGIVFHGAVSADQVKKIMRESIAIIHTESFDEMTRISVKYSVSTKIADSLASGTCIFAYGPSEIASIEYLSANRAAICCTSKSDLKDSLKVLLCDTKTTSSTIKNALRIAHCNHGEDITPNTIREEMQKG